MANSLSHAAAFLAALVAAPFLIYHAVDRGPAAVLGATLFALSAIFVYFSSALFHWFPEGKIKDRFELLDHAGIFLLIAGTYTPFALGALRGGWGTLLLSIIWPVALTGAFLHIRRGMQPRLLTIAIYVAMSYLILVARQPMLERMAREGITLLATGGMVYTGGLFFYFARKVPYHHLAWHLAVMAGTALHYVAVWNYAG